MATGGNRFECRSDETLDDCAAGGADLRARLPKVREGLALSEIGEHLAHRGLKHEHEREHPEHLSFKK
eukprot:3152209-Pleurochrysis_carterae.AAC.2